MPCSDYLGWPDRPDYYDSWCSSKSKLDHVTSILCEAVRWLRHYNHIDLLQQMRNEVVGLGEWIDNHDKMDLARAKLQIEKQRRDDLKRQALSKLSDSEKEALGIK